MAGAFEVPPVSTLSTVTVRLQSVDRVVAFDCGLGPEAARGSERRAAQRGAGRVTVARG